MPSAQAICFASVTLAMSARRHHGETSRNGIGNKRRASGKDDDFCRNRERIRSSGKNRPLECRGLFDKGRNHGIPEPKHKIPHEPLIPNSLARIRAGVRPPPAFFVQVSLQSLAWASGLTPFFVHAPLLRSRVVRAAEGVRRNPLSFDVSGLVEQRPPSGRMPTARDGGGFFCGERPFFRSSA